MTASTMPTSKPEVTLATQVSILRILLIPVAVACLLFYTPERAWLRLAAFAVFLTSALSDALDGWIARATKQYSQLGAFLDPLADKLLLVTLFCALSLMENLPPALRIPAWVTLTIVSRDVILLAGAVTLLMLQRPLELHPRFIGKAATTAQMATIGAVLLYWPVARLFSWIAVVLTICAGIQYVRDGTRLLNHP